MHTDPSEVAAIERPPVSADTVLNLLHEYEDTHETIADRLLGRLIALDPDTAMRQLEAAKSHLDERMVRSAAPFSQALIDELDRVSEATDLDQLVPATKAELAALDEVLNTLADRINRLDRHSTDRAAELKKTQTELADLRRFGTGPAGDIVRMLEIVGGEVAGLTITSPSNVTDRMSGYDSPTTGWHVEVTYREPTQLGELVTLEGLSPSTVEVTDGLGVKHVVPAGGLSFFPNGGPLTVTREGSTSDHPGASPNPT